MRVRVSGHRERGQRKREGLTSDERGPPGIKKGVRKALGKMLAEEQEKTAYDRTELIAPPYVGRVPQYLLGRLVTENARARNVI
jgi:hypothetical protein